VTPSVKNAHGIAGLRRVPADPKFYLPSDQSEAVAILMELDGMTPCSLGTDFHPRNNTPGGYTLPSTLCITDLPRALLYASTGDRTSIAMRMT